MQCNISLSSLCTREDDLGHRSCSASQPKLQAQVELTYELTVKVIELENELHRERKLLEKEQREADDLRAELGRPKLHKRLRLEPILKDAAPEE